MDPQNRNAKMMDQHNALPQVNQVHTVRKAGFGWQTVVALTIIVNLIIHCSYVSECKCREIRTIRAINNIPKNPCIPPKFLKLPPFRQITRNSPTIF